MITACIVTTGRSTLADCEASVRAQTLPVTVDYVRNVAPMDRAFQAMVDQCQTEFLLQVDDDMILDADAVSRLAEALVLEPRAWMALGWLRDSHLAMNIQGLKLYRTERIRSVGFRSTTSCEVDQNKRAEAHGWWISELPEKEPVGRHEIGNDPQVVFERYRTLALKSREYGYHWPRRVPKKMMQRLMSGKGTDRDAMAFAGAIAGFFQPLDVARGEARTDRESHEWTTAKELLG